jgi:hypothetical protein
MYLYVVKTAAIIKSVYRVDHDAVLEVRVGKGGSGGSGIMVIVLLCYCVIVLLCYCGIVSLCHIYITYIMYYIYHVLHICITYIMYYIYHVCIMG